MSTATLERPAAETAIPPVPLTKHASEERARKAAEVCQKFLKSSVSWSPWPGRSRAVDAELRGEWAEKLGADPGSVRGGTDVYNWSDPALVACGALKREAAAWWNRAAPVAWPWAPGCRLLPKGEADAFEERLQAFRADLAGLARVVQSRREELIADARSRRGRAFREADYPADLSQAFGLSWGLEVLAVPKELSEVSSSAYAAEQARQAMRVVGAVQMAEESFTRELLDMVTDLGERLHEPAPGGKRPAIREASLSRVTEFLERFGRAVVWGADDLEEVVGEARGVLHGLGIDDLRHDRTTRERAAAGLAAVAARLREMTPAGDNG